MNNNASILVGVRRNDYINKQGKPVNALNLHFVIPPQSDDVEGSQVIEEYVKDAKLIDCDLKVGSKYRLNYNRGFKGQAFFCGLEPVAEIKQ